MEEILTNESAESHSEYAGFWRRFVANLIDSLILGAGLGIVILLFVLIFSSSLRDFVNHVPHSPPPGDVAGALKYDYEIWPVLLGIYAIECIAISGIWLYY